MECLGISVPDGSPKSTAILDAQAPTRLNPSKFARNALEHIIENQPFRLAFTWLKNIESLTQTEKEEIDGLYPSYSNY